MFGMDGTTVQAAFYHSQNTTQATMQDFHASYQDAFFVSMQRRIMTTVAIDLHGKSQKTVE
jgi:hypothetical protein